MKRLAPALAAALLATGVAGAASAQTSGQGAVSLFAEACVATRAAIDQIDAMAARRGWRRPPEAQALPFVGGKYPAPEASVFQVGPGVVLTVEDRPKQQGALHPQRLCRIWFNTASAEAARRELEQVTIAGTRLGPPHVASEHSEPLLRGRNWRAGSWFAPQAGYYVAFASGRSPGPRFDFNAMISVNFDARRPFGGAPAPAHVREAS